MKKLSILLFVLLFVFISNTHADSRKFHFTYSVFLPAIPKTSERVQIWIPAPQSGLYQKITNMRVQSKYAHSLQTEPEYGNEMIYFDLQSSVPDSFYAQLSFDVTRFAITQAIQSGQVRQDDNNIQRFLQADKLVPIDGEIAQESIQVTAKETNDLAKARALYEHVDRTLRYDKSGTGWGRGDALYACDARQGNCTDFHSLFIGMSRADKIPARFIIGFPIPENKTAGEISGYHCWAEFYLKNRGWIPVDISEANKHPEKRQFYFGGLDANRVQFTMGRDIKLEKANSEELNYFIYPHVVVDGRDFENVKTRFYFSDF